MNCMKLQGLLSPYLDHELSVEEKQIVEKHISSCPACRKELADLQHTKGLLKELSAIPDPKHFSLSLKKRLLKEVSQPATRRIWQSPRRQGWWMSFGTAAAALCLFMVYSFANPEVRDLDIPNHAALVQDAVQLPDGEISAQKSDDSAISEGKVTPYDETGEEPCDPSAINRKIAAHTETAGDQGGTGVSENYSLLSTSSAVSAEAKGSLYQMKAADPAMTMNKIKGIVGKTRTGSLEFGDMAGDTDTARGPATIVITISTDEQEALMIDLADLGAVAMEALDDANKQQKTSATALADDSAPTKAATVIIKIESVLSE